MWGTLCSPFFMTIDYLIIGQGLAGSLLAWQLIQKNCRVLVMDNGLENASQVAAGLINPITGMRFVKSFQVDDYLPIAKQHYAELSCYFQQVFYIEKPMLRLFKHTKEYNNAEKRLLDSNYQNYLGQLQRGSIEQYQTGYLLTRTLLNTLKQFFIQQNSYQQSEFNFSDLQLQPLQCYGIQAKTIIFCEGHHARFNPYFSYLPFQVVKGEILTLQHQQTVSDKILNYGHWLIPLNQNTVRTGATFDTENLNSEATDAAKQELLNALNKVLPLNAQITAHQAQIRPCTLDKQPFIGFHPKHQQLAIFNGFGAKGSLQIPYYAKRFADTLLNNAPLPHHCNIQRYVTA